MKRAHKMDHDQFAKQMTEALQRAGVDRPIRYDKQAFALVIDDGIGGHYPAHLHLGRAHWAYREAHPWQRPRVLERYARVAAQGPIELPPRQEALGRLLPRLRLRSYYSTLASEKGSEHVVAQPHRLVANHLAVGLVLDFPEQTTSVRAEMLVAWEVAEVDAFAQALENLRSRSERSFASPAPGVHVSSWEDDHDATRLVLTEIVRQLEVRGDYVAMIPHPNRLIVTGSEDTRGLELMLDLVEAASKGPCALSAIPVRLRGDEWEPFEVDAAHPSYQRCKELRLRSMNREYSVQGEILPTQLAEQGRDMFVGEFMLWKRPPRGNLISSTAWTDGVPTLLPEADSVGFVRLDSKQPPVIGIADWERVREVAGNLMTPLGLYPERYQVEEFPTLEQLKALGLPQRGEARQFFR